ncbi:MAG: thermonuclease family protein [Nitrososphaeraceae archaeon]
MNCGKGTRKINLERTRKIFVFCVSLIALILSIQTIEQLKPLQLHDQPNIPFENVYASTFDSIPANNLDGIITTVIDGDTLEIRTNEGAATTIRLALVDAPEINELGYNEAKDFVTQNCLHKPATVDPDNNQDLSYGRLVALVYCNGLNINETIIAAGFAEIYSSFCDTSEFGNSDWARKYGCDVRDIDLSDSSIPDETGTINDDVQEEILNNCYSAYSGVCIPLPPPDLDCDDIPNKNFKVGPPDPHNFDGDSDGIGCET